MKKTSLPIRTIPDPVLRAIASPVTRVDTKLTTQLDQLKLSLAQARNPKGVGLAATQLGITRRFFATQLDSNIEIYINPVVTNASDDLSVGEKPDEPDLEGCLSIPRLYGPVPRPSQVTLEYQVILNDELVTRSQKFAGFAARVVQHELDHLDGILFLDYSIKYNLPVYQAESRGDQMVELDEDVLQTLYSTIAPQ